LAESVKVSPPPSERACGVPVLIQFLISMSVNFAITILAA
jgi:hypothetical protein